MDFETRGHRGVDLPVFEEILQKYENLSFLRDDKGKWTAEIPEAGWYQNKDGQLFHYDGVIWDEVPSENLNGLEYLG